VIGEADLEPLNDFRRLQAALFQVGQRVRRLFERVVVETHDLHKEFFVVRVAIRWAAAACAPWTAAQGLPLRSVRDDRHEQFDAW
jgi:hypothetical protein